MSVKTISWVRPVLWCRRHDIAFASHSELGVWQEATCEQFVIWVEDVEKVNKLGLPRCGESE